MAGAQDRHRAVAQTGQRLSDLCLAAFREGCTQLNESEAALTGTGGLELGEHLGVKQPAGGIAGCHRSGLKGRDESKALNGHEGSDIGWVVLLHESNLVTAVRKSRAGVTRTLPKPDRGVPGRLNPPAPAPLFSRISVTARLIALTGVLVMMFVLGNPFEVLFADGLGGTATAAVMAMGVVGLITGILGLVRKEPRSLVRALGIGLSVFALLVKFMLAAIPVMIALSALYVFVEAL